MEVAVEVDEGRNEGKEREVEENGDWSVVMGMNEVEGGTKGRKEERKIEEIG